MHDHILFCCIVNLAAISIGKIAKDVFKASKGQAFSQSPIRP